MSSEVPAGWSQATVNSVVDPQRPVTYGVVQPGPRLSSGGVTLIRGQDYSSGKIVISRSNTAAGMTSDCLSNRLIRLAIELAGCSAEYVAFFCDVTISFTWRRSAYHWGRGGKQKRIAFLPFI